MAALVGERDDLPTTERRADNEALIRARVTQLWQTRMLRLAKLTVADEVENALSYYASTFLREIPRLYRDLERAEPPPCTLLAIRATAFELGEAPGEQALADLALALAWAMAWTRQTEEIAA